MQQTESAQQEAVCQSLDLLDTLAELVLQNQAEAQLQLTLDAFAAGAPPEQAGSVWTGPCPQLQDPAAQLRTHEAAWLERAAQLWAQPAAEVGLAQSQVASHQGLPSWSWRQPAVHQSSSVSSWGHPRGTLPRGSLG